MGVDLSDTYDIAETCCYAADMLASDFDRVSRGYESDAAEEQRQGQTYAKDDGGLFSDLGALPKIWRNGRQGLVNVKYCIPLSDWSPTQTSMLLTIFGLSVEGVVLQYYQ